MRRPSERRARLRPRPRMTSAASRAWYLPTWVSSARPFASPTTYSHSWPGTRIVIVDLDRASVAAGRTVSRPSSSVCGRAPDRDEQLLAGERSAVLELQRDRTVSPSSRRNGRGPQSDDAARRPASRSAASTCSPANCSSPASSRGSASMTVTLAPSDAYACAISTPTTPPPSTISDARHRSCAVVTSRLVQGRASREARDRRHERPAAGCEHDGLARAQHARSPTRISRSPASFAPAAHAARSCAPAATAAGHRRRGCGRPRRGARARPPRRAPRSPPRGARHTARLGQHLGRVAAAPSRACRHRTSTRPRPARARRARPSRPLSRQTSRRRPRPPARRRGQPHRNLLCCSLASPYLDEGHASGSLSRSWRNRSPASCCSPRRRLRSQLQRAGGPRRRAQRGGRDGRRAQQPLGGDGRRGGATARAGRRRAGAGVRGRPGAADLDRVPGGVPRPRRRRGCWCSGGSAFPRRTPASTS